jgi:23S rRNA (adenine2503-C2)-methyltransferase
LVSSDIPTRLDLRSLTLEETRALVERLGLPRYRAEQLFRGVHARAVESLEALTDLGKELRQKLCDETRLARLGVDLEQVSRDGTRKLRLRTEDGRLIETVLIPDGDASAPDDDEDDFTPGVTPPPSPSPPRTRGGRSRYERRPSGPSERLEQTTLKARSRKMTQCVSSQVGCALDCAFCATAKLGFGRQLGVGEIVEQVYLAERILRRLDEGDPTRRAGADRVTNLVFMGMGEPLHNYANVLSAFHILTDQRGRDFSRRRITISTAGLVPAIEKLAAEAKQPNLAVSLNASTDEVRDEIMPINRKWKIARLLEAVKKVAASPGHGTRRKITFEYVLLDGVNDTDADARRLVALLQSIPCKVNLIPWNPHPREPGDAPFGRPSDARVQAFHRLLMERGLPVYVRRSRGDDIDAACGQLAGRKDAPASEGAAEGTSEETSQGASPGTSPGDRRSSTLIEKGSLVRR